MTTQTPSTPMPEKPAKKGGIGKWIVRIFATLVVLVVLLVAGLYLFRNTLVKMGVERGGKYATLQETMLDSADLSLGNGTLELSSLGIANLTPTYKEAHFLTMKSCKVGVDSGSLLSNNVHVKEISIDGLEIWLEQNGFKSNLGDILDAINKQTGGGGAASGGGTKEAGQAPPGKNLSIDVIRLSGTKVHIRGMANMDFDLGSFEIAEPTNPDGRPMKIANVIGTVLIHVAAQIAKNPQLPGGFKDSLKSVDQIMANVTKGLPKDLGGLGKDLGKNLQDVGKGIDLKNLNPFDKKKP